MKQVVDLLNITAPHQADDRNFSTAQAKIPDTMIIPVQVLWEELRQTRTVSGRIRADNMDMAQISKERALGLVLSRENLARINVRDFAQIHEEQLKEFAKICEDQIQVLKDFKEQTEFKTSLGRRIIDKRSKLENKLEALELENEELKARLAALESKFSISFLLTCRYQFRRLATMT